MIVWSWSDMGIFFLKGIGLVSAVFLLCLFLGQLTAMARLSRVPALTQILNVVFALFRRVPALAFMGLLLAWQRGLGDDLSSAMVFVVLLLCFVPEMSDVQMESMRKAPESRNPEGAGAWRLFKQSLAFAFAERTDVFCGIWTRLFLFAELYGIPAVMGQCHLADTLMFAGLIVGYWLGGLLLAAVMRRLCRRLSGRA